MRLADHRELRLSYRINAQLVIAQPQRFRQRNESFSRLVLSKLRQPEWMVLDVAVLPADFELDRRARILRRRPQRNEFGVFADHDRRIERTRGLSRAERSPNQAASFIGRNMLASPSIDVLGFNPVVDVQLLV